MDTYVITADSNGFTGKLLQFYYWNATLKGIGTETMILPTEVTDLTKINYTALENQIGQEIIAKKMMIGSLFPKMEVQIYGFEVITIAMVNGMVNKKPITFQHTIATSAMHYVGGKLLERHEALNMLGGDLAKLRDLPPGHKCVTTCVPGMLYAFNEGENVFIPRAAKSQLVM